MRILRWEVWEEKHDKWINEDLIGVVILIITWISSWSCWVAIWLDYAFVELQKEWLAEHWNKKCCQLEGNSCRWDRNGYATKGSTKVLVYLRDNREKSSKLLCDYGFFMTAYSIFESEFWKYMMPPRKKCIYIVGLDGTQGNVSSWLTIVTRNYHGGVVDPAKCSHESFEFFWNCF